MSAESPAVSIGGLDWRHGTVDESEHLSDEEFVAELVRKLQREPWHVLKNHCFHKAFKFKRMCAARGIKAKVILTIGIQPVLKWHLAYVSLHARGWINGKEYEVAHTREYVSPFWTNAHDFRSLIGIWV